MRSLRKRVESIKNYCKLKRTKPAWFGPFVDFSHGDVDAHPPIPGFIDVFNEGYHEGGAQAYTVITPGTEFGPQFTNHFRINFSQDKTKAIAAIERVVELVKRYRKAYSEEICAILGNPLLGTRTTIGVASLPGQRH